MSTPRGIAHRLLCALSFAAGSAGICLAQSLTGDEAARYQELDARRLGSFTNVDLADYLKSLRRIRPDEAPPARIELFARKAFRQAYRPNARRFDPTESDCVTFVENTIALSLATDWESYYLLCERLRHKDGLVAYKNRNFFTLGDWLPNNTAWLLKDITGDLQTPEGPAASTFTHVVRPKVFEEQPAGPGGTATRIIFKGSDYKSPDKQVRTETYIPRAEVVDILPQLKTGDIVLVLREAAGGHKGCDHMGIILREADGQVYLAQSAPAAVRQESVRGFLFRYNHVSGLKFLRLRDDAVSRAGAEVASMKSKGTPIRSPEAEDQRNASLRIAQRPEQNP